MYSSGNKLLVAPMMETVWHVAMSKLTMGNTRAAIGLVICLIIISYGMFWHSAPSLRPKLIGTSHFSADLLCMEELLTAFKITAVNVSMPTYIQLQQPLSLPDNGSCRHLLHKPAPPLPPSFKKFRVLNLAQEHAIPTILHNLLTNFTQRRLELFLAGGSLLGSMRHFGFFPWDFDIDVMILTSQKPQVRQYLIELSASDEYRFVDTENTNQHWQLGIFCTLEPGKPPTRMYNTKRLYPSKTCASLVDLFFGRSDGSYYRRLESPFSFPIKDVYPLRPRPFGPYLIPGPGRPDNFLRAVYGAEYEHRCVSKYGVQQNFPCINLRSAYPFVTHLRLPYKRKLINIDVLEFNATLTAMFIPQQQ